MISFALGWSFGFCLVTMVSAATEGRYGQAVGAAICAIICVVAFARNL